MKKLGKLKLNESCEMTDKEMKNIAGGSGGVLGPGGCSLMCDTHGYPKFVEKCPTNRVEADKICGNSGDMRFMTCVC